MDEIGDFARIEYADGQAEDIQPDAAYSTPEGRANFSARDLLFKAERRQNGIFDE